ncbi:hypothetical protein PMI01_00384 [Caulobacter sp. AP07]|uniref:hypothetical protein n=1 Tax=Caulobacter sp. AP07 TaxID=1144304 RepID=UPI0002721AA1|nr:hypothetical protein [Caulobacter sp. AP07]EJL37974.1 hypothetical protein PMI01_00384 [Caulobacter sp. AP07]
MSNLPVANFTTSDAGQNVGTAVAPSGVTLNVGDQLSINGSTDLSKIIVGNSSALVNAIQLQTGSFTQYELQIQGQGPAGAGSGSLVVTIIDGDGDSHWLKLNSSTNKVHELGFNTANPTVNTISWAPGTI